MYPAVLSEEGKGYCAIAFMKKLDIVLVGVGGQGSLLASRVLGNIAPQLGLDVKVSEVHGMSQRGGSVSTYVRMGEKVHGPLVEQKQADYIIAFEELEALRALPYLKDEGTIIVNTQKILPLPVITGAAKYPEDIAVKLEENAKTIALDALGLANKAGNSRTVNIVMLGVLSSLTDIDIEIWHKALEASIPQRFIKANMAAFELGANVNK